jgi:hypothetical protein
MISFLCSGLLTEIVERTEGDGHEALQSVISLGIDDNSLTNLYHNVSN